MTDAIRAALEGAGAYLTEHPHEARYTDAMATAREIRLYVRAEEGQNSATGNTKSSKA